jgi:hypothetical protein
MRLIARACMIMVPLVASCGGGGGQPTSGPISTPTYLVVANVSGLSGSGLSLSIGGANVSVSTNGFTTLGMGLNNGSAYTVVIYTQPINPVQTCSLTGGSGNITGSDATVTIACVAGTATTVNAASAKVSIDSSVPAPTQSAIANILSSIDSETVGSPLLVPIGFSGAETLVFAVDSSGNILLASLASQPTVTLSPRTTALALTRMALGALPSTLSAAQLNADIEASSDFPMLESSILTSLTSTNSLFTSAAVAQELFRVIAEVPAQDLSAFGAAARQHAGIKASPVQQPSLPQAPFDLLSNSSPTPIDGRLTVTGATATGGLTIQNTTPLVWSVSSKDTSGNVLCGPTSGSGANPTCTVNIDSTSLTDLLRQNLALDLFEPSGSAIAGNGAAFNITVYQGVTSLTANLIQMDEDLLSVIASFAGEGELTPACFDGVAGSLFPPANIASVIVQITNGGVSGASSAINAYLASVFSLKNAVALFNATVTCGAAIDVPKGTDAATLFTSFESAYAGFINYLTGKGSGDLLRSLTGGGLIQRIGAESSYAGFSKTFGVCETSTALIFAVSDCTFSLSFSPSSITLVPTTDYSLQPTAIDVNGGNTLSPNDLIFTSPQANSIISLDQQTGTVTAQLLNGVTGATATVTATSNSTGISANYTINVNSQPSMTLTSNPQTLAATGGALMLTASVSPPSGAVGVLPAFNGTVTFSDTQSGVLCSNVSLINGSATCSPQSAIVPPDNIRANFLGDTIYSPTSASTTITSLKVVSSYTATQLPFIANATNGSGQIVGYNISIGSLSAPFPFASGAALLYIASSGHAYSLAALTSNFSICTGSNGAGEPVSIGEDGSIILNQQQGGNGCLLTPIAGSATSGGVPNYLARQLPFIANATNGLGQIVGYNTSVGSVSAPFPFAFGAALLYIPSSGQAYSLAALTSNFSVCTGSNGAGEPVSIGEDGSIILNQQQGGNGCLLTPVANSAGTGGVPTYMATQLPFIANATNGIGQVVGYNTSVGSVSAPFPFAFGAALLYIPSSGQAYSLAALTSNFSVCTGSNGAGEPVSIGEDGSIILNQQQGGNGCLLTPVSSQVASSRKNNASELYQRRSPSTQHPS